MNTPHDLDDQVEVTHVTAGPPVPVKKQVWNPDTNQFEPTTYYRVPEKLSHEQRDWMWDTFGPPGRYHSRVLWNRVQDQLVMCSEVYMMYTLRWGCKK